LGLINGDQALSSAHQHFLASAGMPSHGTSSLYPSPHQHPTKTQEREEGVRGHEVGWSASTGKTRRVSMRAQKVRRIVSFLFSVLLTNGEGTSPPFFSTRFDAIGEGATPPRPFRPLLTRTGRVQPLPSCYRRVSTRLGRAQPLPALFDLF